jgi:hypothetical protein
VPFVAGLAALLFALHLLSGSDDDSAAPEHPSAPPVLAAPSASASASLSAAEIEGLMAGKPEETLHSVAGLLPHNERDAQRLKALEVRALVERGRLRQAQERARDYFERWPGGPDTATLEELTGVHPAPAH